MSKKFYYHGKKDTAQNGSKAPSAPRYSAEKLTIVLESIGISATTCELLAKCRINTTGDLTSKTERDMFRIQGFNKKMLIELRNALKSVQMTFKPEEEKLKQPAKPETDDKSDNSDNRKTGKPVISNGRNGRADINNAPKQNNNYVKENGKGKDIPRDNERGRTDTANQKQPVRAADNPEKLSEPLPVEKWRKIQKGNKWGFFDGFKTVIPAMYDEVAFFRDGLASVEIDEKCGYIDSTNNIVIPLDYETAMSFSEGYACVVKGGKCGYIDKENNVVIDFEYDAATPFEEGEAKVKKIGRWGTITPDGVVKWII